MQSPIRNRLCNCICRDAGDLQTDSLPKARDVLSERGGSVMDLLERCMLLGCNCQEQIGRLVRVGQPDTCVLCCTLAVLLLLWIDGCIAVPVTISIEL